MSLHAIDTLQFTERLEKVGFSREQASELSKTLDDSMQEKLATKQDLGNLVTKEDLHKELQKFATKEDIRFLFGATIAILTLVMTALKFLH
jgi:hypothetical protein